MRQWLSRYRTELGLYFGFTLLCAFFLLKGDRFPTVFPEETGYIGWGNKLLGEEGSGLYFLPGYSLFLLPFLAITRDIAVIYPWMLWMNILMNGFLIVGLYRLAGSWGMNGIQRILTAVTVSLYAPFVLYTQKVICETLLITCGVWLAVFLNGAFEGRKRNWIGVIGLGIFMLITHSRAFVLVPVFLLFLLLCYSHKKEIRIGAGIVLLAGILCLIFVFTDSGVTSVHLKNQLLGLCSFRGFKNMAMTLISQSSYWMLSTFGLASAGIWYGITTVRKKEQGWQSILFVLLYFTGTALLSALYMSHRSQMIHMIYGRYNDGAIAGILLLGMIAYQKKTPPKWVWAVSIIPVAITALLYWESLLQLPQTMINICGLYFSKLFVWNWDIRVIFPVCLLLSFLLWWGFRKNKILGIVLFGGWFLFQLFFAMNHFVTGEREPNMTAIIDQLDREDLVLYTEDDYVRSFFRYACYRPELQLSETDNPHPEEGNVEISETVQKEQALLGAENGTFLWARDEKTAEKYSHLMLPLDGEITEPNSEIKLMEWKDCLKVRVTNLGSPWMSIYAVWDVQKAVRLGVRFFDHQGMLIEEQRGNFGKNMLRGDSHDFTFSWPEGAEIASFELVQEFRNWFSELGDEGALTVNRQGKEVSCPQRDNGFHTLYPQFLISRNEKDTLPDKTNLQGFSGDFTGKKSSYCHIDIDCKDQKELVVKTKESDRINPTLIVTLNDSVPLDVPVCKGGEYIYSLQGFEGRINKITVECETYNPFEESGLPEWMSFLSLDSNVKPVQFMVHRMEDILGKSVNNHEYGIQIERIIIR